MAVLIVKAKECIYAACASRLPSFGACLRSVPSFRRAV